MILAGRRPPRSYEESEGWWLEPVRPHPEAPYVINFLLADAAFRSVAAKGAHHTMADIVETYARVVTI